MLAIEVGYLRASFHWRADKDSADEETLNVNTRIISCLNSHLILAGRNLLLSDLDSTTVSNFMAAFVHLNCRHSFNTGRQVDLPNTKYLIPETELYEALQVQRRRLVQWAQPVKSAEADKREALRANLSESLSKLRAVVNAQPATEETETDSIALCSTVASINIQLQALSATRESELTFGVATPSQLNDVMSTIQSITSDTGSFAGPDDEILAENAENWGFIEGWNNTGRFTVTSLGSPGDSIISLKASAGL